MKILFSLFLIMITLSNAGVNITYYDNGKIKETITMKNGKKNGLYQLFYNNGILRLETYYINNKPHGIGLWYSLNGSLSQVQYHNYGKRVNSKKYIEKTNK